MRWINKQGLALAILTAAGCLRLHAQENSFEMAYWRAEMLRNYDRVQAVAGDTRPYTQDELRGNKVDASMCWHDSVRAYMLVNRKTQGTIDFAFTTCEYMFTPIINSWYLQDKARGDAFNRWVWPLTVSALLSLRPGTDMPDTWDDLQAGIRPSEKYKLSAEDRLKGEEIEKAKVKLSACVKRLPRPSEGTWFWVSSQLRSYVMACSGELVTLMGSGAGSTKELGLGYAVLIASTAANCKFANSTPNSADSERLVVCLP